MDRSLRALILSGACLLAGIQPAAGVRAARPPARLFVPVLIYHHVKAPKPGDDAIERGLSVLPGAFAAQLQYLRFHGYHTVTASTLVDALRGGKQLPPRPIVLTFDDGYSDIYPNVYPLLRRYRMTATFFIAPGLLDKPRYMSWRQIATLASHGMDVEAHSMSHPDLTMVSAAQRHGEIWDSRRVLEARLHRAVRVFAYPYGAYNASVLADVAHAGYLAAFTTHEGWLAGSDQLLTLPRVYVDPDDTIDIFAGRLRADPHALAADPV